MIADFYVYLTDIHVHKEVYINNSLLTVQQWYYMYKYLIIYIHINWYFCISWSIDSLSIRVWMINDERMFGTSKNNSLTAIEPKAEST